MKARLSSVWCDKCDQEMKVVDVSPDPGDWHDWALYCPSCKTFGAMPEIELLELATVDWQVQDRIERECSGETSDAQT
jgi:hypothetical protein